MSYGPPIRGPLYFGCHRVPGHYLWAPGMYRASSYKLDFIDTTICPPNEPQGVANLVHLNLDGPRTVIAFWDLSVDLRPGSNSAFILPGLLGFAAAVAEVWAAFPEVWSRFGFEVTEWGRLASEAKSQPRKDAKS